VEGWGSVLVLALVLVLAVEPYDGLSIPNPVSIPMRLHYRRGRYDCIWRSIGAL